MAAVRILLLSIAAAVGYGLVQDQITIRVCPEYFTIGHPRIFPVESLTLLALCWGVAATWWVGLLLGVPLTLAARAGTRPKLGARDLLRPVGLLLAGMAVLSVVAGLAGRQAARAGAVILVEPLASRVPASSHVPFIADLWATLAAYGTGFAGGIVVCVRTWRKRGVAPPS